MRDQTKKKQTQQSSKNCECRVYVSFCVWFFFRITFVRCYSLFCRSKMRVRKFECFRVAKCPSKKTTLRLFRPKTLFVIMLRRQNACERSASLFSDEMLAWKNSYRTSRHRQTRKQCFLWVYLCVLPCVLPKNKRWSWCSTLTHSLRSLSLSLARAPQADQRFDQRTENFYVGFCVFYEDVLPSWWTNLIAFGKKSPK